MNENEYEPVYYQPRYEEEEGCTDCCYHVFCSCFYKGYARFCVEDRGATALNAVDSVKLLYMKRIDMEYMHHVPFLNQPVTIQHLGHKHRLQRIIALEHALKRYQRKHKKILENTANPIHLSETYENKIKAILQHYDRREVERIRVADEKVGFFRSISTPKLSRIIDHVQIVEKEQANFHFDNTSHSCCDRHGGGSSVTFNVPNPGASRVRIRS